MLADPSQKYPPFSPIALPDRQWPGRILRSAPQWMSTDLRDGNQALIEPLDGEAKLRFFQLLVEIGFKEIEVAFPAASQTDFDFVRRLIDEDHIPDDVTIEVITQAREDLIRRTFDALRGARRSIVHLYNATAPQWRETVFASDRAGAKALALAGTRLIRELADADPATDWVFQYSPETFSATEPEFALEVCNAVIAAWEPMPERKMIVNLPATVELSTPNHYADQIEWMHRHLARRDSIILSVHPHNDRGTAVAAAELALLAGAERVEGCLFGNGERTGNVDLVTLALNLYSQGVAPGLDFSDIDAVRRQVEEFNRLPVHPRHPYAGELVYTAFSGSHQDAIKKGLDARRPGASWQVPYLPLDPADVGRSYDAVIRVNSQSGKGGISYLLQSEHGLRLPRRMQIEFSRLIQQHTDASGQEVTADELYALFHRHYLEARVPYRCHGFEQQYQDDGTTTLSLQLRGESHRVHGQGGGTLEALLDALSLEARIGDYHEHTLGSGADARAACYVELQLPGLPACYGAGIDRNITAAAIDALLSALNRSLAEQPDTPQARCQELPSRCLPLTSSR
ncbi:2-isopropylmalate synthase [Pseudogulbenkiania sp. MAI-1]|uniref:2-isopropylmalate synthase n=1 Tax=Pseudogulbenkiania sp. MAI-1 TaxID=990370 RepID=UPI00045EBE4B|nr:2-isopropylmalate synthase [Pseudogulbenkiania sp. MAI-1]